MHSQIDFRGIAGGANRDRTGDLLLAKQALSQLSYGPCKGRNSIPSLGDQLVGLGGLEPPTPRLSSVCSNQLSYRPGRRAAASSTADKCGREMRFRFSLERR